jgi:hypothetical protein
LFQSETKENKNILPRMPGSAAKIRTWCGKDTGTSVLSITLLRRMGSEVRLRTFFISALEEREQSASRSEHFNPRKQFPVRKLFAGKLDEPQIQPRSVGNENNFCRDMDIDGPS